MNFKMEKPEKARQKEKNGIRTSISQGEVREEDEEKKSYTTWMNVGTGVQMWC